MRFIQWICGKVTGHRCGQIVNIIRSPYTAATHFGERYCRHCGKFLASEALYIDARGGFDDGAEGAQADERR